MKNKRVILLVLLLMAIASLSCKFLTPDGQPTEEPTFNDVRGPLKFEPATLPSAQVGAAYEAEIHISENATPAGDIFISEGTLPAGLELTKVEGEDTARISGTPQEAGTFSFTVHAWCYGTQVSGQEGDKKYDLVVEK